MYKFCYSTKSERIDRIKGEHNHPPNPQKLRAMLEEVTVVQSMVETLATQQLKPHHVLSKVCFLSPFYTKHQYYP